MTVEGLDPERQKVVTGLVAEAFTGEHYESFVTAFFRNELAENLSASSNAELADQVADALSHAIAGATQSSSNRVSDLLPSGSVVGLAAEFPLYS